jgi:energy-coupling factor transporter ATP-binding protein EcfA2
MAKPGLTARLIAVQRTGVSRIVLLGCNEAGKTTLLKIINGEIARETGERWVRPVIRTFCTGSPLSSVTRPKIWPVVLDCAIRQSESTSKLRPVRIRNGFAMICLPDDIQKSRNLRHRHAGGV